MTDEELIARLRDLHTHSRYNPSMHSIAADRIEALIKEFAVSNELGKAFEKDAGQLRDKLAKAVEGLQFYTEKDDYERQRVTMYCGCCSYYEDPIILDDKGKLARAVLAELETPK